MNEDKNLKPECYDCGLLYTSNAWADIVVPDNIWKLITPNKEHWQGGLLCFNCMNKRLTELKLDNVPYYIASGPFCFRVRNIENAPYGNWSWPDENA